MTNTSEEDRAAQVGEVLVSCEGVSKVYPMGTSRVVALDAVDLQIRAGSFVAVVGRSGSGKSTLLHMLAALDQPTAGTVRVGAWDLTRMGSSTQVRYRRSMVGMVFQEFNLVPSLTALENVELPLVLAGVGPEERRERARTSLEAVDLMGRADHRPAELSGGEQQRVALARALVHNPPLLLADEPTGNLDSVTGAAIIELLREIQRAQDKTVVVVTHQPEELAHVVQQHITLHDGKIVEIEEA